MPQPPVQENKPLTWPDWPLKLRTSSSHEEGAERDFAVMTTRFSGRNGRVSRLHCVRVDAGFKPIPGTEFELKADLVLLAMGFVSPVHRGTARPSSASRSTRAATSRPTRRAYRTSVDKVFSAGDMRRGQSLVVWAIREGRQAARAIDEHLMGASVLPA